MTQEALSLAIDAMVFACKKIEELKAENKAFKEALAQEQEPDAWMHVQGNYKEPSFRELADDEVERGWEQYPLYTHPQQRTWVGLAAEDRLTAKYMQDAPDGIEAVIDYIEAKLKEKNT